MSKLHKMSTKKVMNTLFECKMFNLTSNPNTNKVKSSSNTSGAPPLNRTLSGVQKVSTATDIYSLWG